MFELIKLSEPTLLFGHNQALEDPRDGLTLFGPLDATANPYGIRYGVIGTKNGIRRFRNWVNKLQRPISNNPPHIARPPFPGFEAIFGIPFSPQPALTIQIHDGDLKRAVYIDDRHQRVFNTVDIYAKKILETTRQEDEQIDIWFVIIPDEVYQYCRPQSSIPSSNQIKAKNRMSPKWGRRLQREPSLFKEDEENAIPYQYEVNFHNQLKARLLADKIPTQIIRESTIAHQEIITKTGRPTRDLDKQLSAIAWNIATAAYYKVGGRPWKISKIRSGVCYIGLVFKRDEKHVDPQNACCAAQMFLDSGDGIVFKGAVGPWYNPKKGDFHLRKKDATELIRIALNSYEQKEGKPPSELFLHGRTWFNDEEWEGFKDAVTKKTNLVGIRIKGANDLKLYRKEKFPVLRGLAYVESDKNAYLWTKGFTPRLQNYIGREVPKPILIDVCRGEARIETVLNDIMALTKLNYNTCMFADGIPVTLRFADSIGEILTAGPIGNVPPLQFKYYI